MDTEFIQWFTTLGIGGILAAFMFTFYRKDVKQYTELWKTTADQLMLIVKENTASNIKLIALIEQQERNTLRKSDLSVLLDKKVDIIKRDNQ